MRDYEARWWREWEAQRSMPFAHPVHDASVLAGRRSDRYRSDNAEIIRAQIGPVGGARVAASGELRRERFPYPAQIVVDLRRGRLHSLDRQRDRHEDLEAGGNAFDAAAAAGFVLQIVEPHLNGPGGDANILACRTDAKEPTLICGQGPSPAAGTINHFEILGLDLIPGAGLLAACVPGAFGPWLTMLRNWGTVSLRDVLEPAIQHAKHGHPILASAAQTIGSVQSLFTEHWCSSADIFLPGGQVTIAGRPFANPMLGAFYEKIAGPVGSFQHDPRRTHRSRFLVLVRGPVGVIAESLSERTLSVRRS